MYCKVPLTPFTLFIFPFLIFEKFRFPATFTPIRWLLFLTGIRRRYGPTD